jgi:hypothetical protein
LLSAARHLSGGRVRFAAPHNPSARLNAAVRDVLFRELLSSAWCDGESPRGELARLDVEPTADDPAERDVVTESTSMAHRDFRSDVPGA